MSIPSHGQHLSHDRMQVLLTSDIDMSLAERELAHLDGCAECRESMELLVADASWWNKARSYLSQSSGQDLGTDGFASSVLVQSRDLDLDAARQLLEPPGHPEMLGRIDHFDIEEVLGQGGMGIVFKGYDRELNRAVAVKFLAPHLAANGTARQRFAREARAAAAITHPNVVPIHAIRGDKRPYLVMALVGGPSLQALVEQRGPMEITEVVRIGMQIAAGLAAAHRQGLVHRDIKPSNILLEGEAGRALITDFGLARAADDATVTQSGWLAGTPHYMSPEQTRGEDLDGRSDLFSLGSVLYFLATGREPFRAEQGLAVLRKIGQEEPLPACHVQSQVPRPLSQLIARLHSKKPEDRFASAEELHGVMEQYLASLQHPQTHACPACLLPTRSRRTRRRSAVLAGVLMGLVMIWGFLQFLPEPMRGVNQPSDRRAEELIQSPSAELAGIDPWERFTREKEELERAIDHMEATLRGSNAERTSRGPQPEWRQLEQGIEALERRGFDW